MVLRLDNQNKDFETRFVRLLAQKREVALDVDSAVREILDGVRTGGDNAVVDYTRRFDDPSLAQGISISQALAVSAKTIEEAYAACDAETLDALQLAAKRIRAYHEKQKPSNERFTDETGVELGWRWTPVESAGIYVPGGTASYPSSVLMNAIPAIVAGVKRIVMMVPAPNGELNPLVLAAAKLCGVEEIYRIGGAQAIGALAYGTETIKPVVKIAGPGNAYVAAAKRQVFGTVGIDMIAGPSEVLVIADGENDPDWVAADLLAQAEHDESAQSILITDSSAFGDRVLRAVEAQLTTLPRAAIAGKSWADNGAIITVDSLHEAPALADCIAAEHLEIMTDDPEALLAKISNAGAVFLGRYTPEAIGDYVGGSNHVLPTARSARYSSGLSVLDYMKRTSILRLEADQLAEIGPAAVRLAASENLEAHGRSVTIRLNR